MKSSVATLSLRKKGERELSLSPCQSAISLENGRDVVGVVGFVGFTEVALTAELGRRGRVGVGNVADVRVVGAVHEEVRRIVARGVAGDWACCTGRVNGHDVLVMAGGAEDEWLASCVNCPRIAPLAWREGWIAVVRDELGIRRTSSDCEGRSGPGQTTSGPDRRVRSHWVVVRIISSAGAIVAEQRRDWVGAVGRIRQKTNSLLIRYVGHHVRWCQVAIMAAEAEKNAADFLRTTRDTVGQNFRVRTIITEGSCLAVQRAGILAPQCVASGIRRSLLARTERAAVWLVTARAAAAVVVVCAEDVNRGRPILAHRHSSAGQCENRYQNHFFHKIKSLR